MDTFASLALATEPPTEKQLYRKPHNRYEYIASKKMCKHIIGQAIMQLIILLILVFKGETFLPEYADLCSDYKKGCYDDEVLEKYYTANQTVGSETRWPDYL